MSDTFSRNPFCSSLFQRKNLLIKSVTFLYSLQTTFYSIIYWNMAKKLRKVEEKSVKLWKRLWECLRSIEIVSGTLGSRLEYNWIQVCFKFEINYINAMKSVAKKLYGSICCREGWRKKYRNNYPLFFLPFFMSRVFTELFQVYFSFLSFIQF